MPNIKFYGVIEKNLNYTPDKEKADKLLKQVKKLFEKESCYKETVVTFEPSTVKDLEGNSQPYIQLELDCTKNYEKKIGLLKTLGYDIQVVKLHEFIPKE
ncbi:MAG TPA: hypothetical protein VJ892_02280 [Candidatus Absconditabacterales bacterium]|nr:hypothetical protein [Candidatus Absconditabacterales bacterium]